MPTRLYPARVTLPDGTEVAPVAVWWDGERARVYQAAQDRGDRNREVVEIEVVSPVGSDTRGSRWTFDLDDGRRLVAVKAGGCGCGHPLKTFRPARTA